MAIPRLLRWLPLIAAVTAAAACGGPTPTPTADVPATQTRTGELAILATAAAPTATSTATPVPTDTPTPRPPTATPTPPRPTRTPTRVGACSADDARRTLAVFQPQAQEWDDAYAVAASAPRISLAQPIADLQRVRRDTSALAVPACGQNAKRLMVAFMDKYIDGFIDFLGQGYRYPTLFTEAKKLQEEWSAELKRLVGS